MLRIIIPRCWEQHSKTAACILMEGKVVIISYLARNMRIGGHFSFISRTASARQQQRPTCIAIVLVTKWLISIWGGGNKANTRQSSLCPTEQWQHNDRCLTRVKAISALGPLWNGDKLILNRFSSLWAVRIIIIIANKHLNSTSDYIKPLECKLFLRGKGLCFAEISRN